MPRKKATTKDEATPSAPKRTRRNTAKRVATAASTPAPDRPRIMSAEEKRQLILAHAAERQPVDTVQRFSLWTGVVVCVLAITIGWVYTMRQSIAGAIITGNTQEEQIDYDELKSSIHSNISDMVDQIDTLQEDHMFDLRVQAEALKAINELEQSTSTQSASSTTATSTETSARGDLFQPSSNSGDSEPNNFELPPGVSIDVLNNN
jgi:hypothetical protein